MPDQLESALVIVLRNKIPWESALEISSAGTLTSIDPATFSHVDYQARDRQLAFRDLTTAAAVIEASVEVSNVWGFTAPRPRLEGPARKELVNAPIEQSFSGTHGSVRHVGQTSIPWDAARYADKDLYGRDAIIYETLAKAVTAVFATDPPVNTIDMAGTVPQTSIWSTAEGLGVQADINSALALNRDLFKLPDQNLADRDNQLAAYVSQMCQALKNPFRFATRIYVETTGADEREPEVYVLARNYFVSGTQYSIGDEVFYQDRWYRATAVTTDTPSSSANWTEIDEQTERTWLAEPSLSNRNRIVYDINSQTLQWFRETLNSVHVPQIFALSIPGIDPGQVLTTLPRVPDPRDAQYWRTKAAHIIPAGPMYTEELSLDFTASDQVSGGYTQIPAASLTVPDALEIRLNGSIPAGLHRVSCLVVTDPVVEIGGAQNITGTTGTLGGATFETNVSTVQSGVQYLVEGGSVIYAGGTYAAGQTFYGLSGTASFSAIGLPTVRQYEVAWRIALPPGAWSVALDYTNITGSTSGFGINAQYARTGNAPIDVISEATPLSFSGNNGNIQISPLATFDVLDEGEFSFPVRWKTGAGQLHVRQLTFSNATQETGRFAMSGTFGEDVSALDVTGQRYMPEVMAFDFQTGSVFDPIFRLDWTGDAELPLQVKQVHVQLVGTNSATPSIVGFEGWRQEALERAGVSVQSSFHEAVKAYGTNIPVFLDTGSVWSVASSENWMSFIEVTHPRLREQTVVDSSAIRTGRQYEVTVGPVVYDSGTFTTGEKFYGVDNVTTYTSGSVKQVGAFVQAGADHLGRPALIPDGIFFDALTGTVSTSAGPAESVPQLASCLPWMIEVGLYVAQPDFWLPDQL